jgi:hypothetical protein
MLAVGCSDKSPTERATPTTPQSTTSSSAKAVREDPNVDHNVFATKNELQATPHGFRPLTMVALIDNPISIVNGTPSPLVVRFTNYTTPQGIAETPPIAPGASFSWTADSGHSIVVVADGVPGQANIVIEPNALKVPDGGAPASSNQ